MGNKHPLQTLLEMAHIPIRSYSGRGMFGRTCLAAEVDRIGPFVAKIVTQFSSFPEWDGFEAALGALERGWSEDSMGKGIVVYWPNVPYVEPNDE